jgi:hypothetical protein
LIETIQQQTRDGKELVDFMSLTFRSGPMRYRMEAAHWLTEREIRKQAPMQADLLQFRRHGK